MKICIKFKNGINFTDEGSSINYDDNTASIDFSKTVNNKKYGSFVKTYSFYYGSIKEIIVNGRRYDNRLKPTKVKYVQITMGSHPYNSNDECPNCVYSDVPLEYYPCKACNKEASFFIDKPI